MVDYRRGTALARTLALALRGVEYGAAPVKVDRSKLYGRVETVALDSQGNVCELALMDPDGTLVIPRGGTGIGLLADGTWVDRSELIAVDPDGSPLPLHPSSFDAPVQLEGPCAPEDLLDAHITAVYQLDVADPGVLTAIGTDIYTFEYFYRAGHSGSLAFVLVSSDTAFLLVGQPARFEFLGLDAAAELVEAEEADADLDDLDFSMM